MNRSLSLDEWKSILQYTKMPHKYTSVASTLTPYHKELREQLNKRLEWYEQWESGTNTDIYKFYLNMAALNDHWDIFLYILDYYMNSNTNSKVVTHITKVDIMERAIRVLKVTCKWDILDIVVDKYITPNPDLSFKLSALGISIPVGNERPKHEKQMDSFYKGSVSLNVLHIVNYDVYNKKMIEYLRNNIKGIYIIRPTFIPVLLYTLLERNDIHMENNPSIEEIEIIVNNEKLPIANRIAIAKVYKLQI